MHAKWSTESATAVTSEYSQNTSHLTEITVKTADGISTFPYAVGISCWDHSGFAVSSLYLTLTDAHELLNALRRAVAGLEPPVEGVANELKKRGFNVTFGIAWRTGEGYFELTECGRKFFIGTDRGEWDADVEGLDSGGTQPFGVPAMCMDVKTIADAIEKTIVEGFLPELSEEFSDYCTTYKLDEDNIMEIIQYATGVTVPESDDLLITLTPAQVWKLVLHTRGIRKETTPCS